MGRRQDPLLAVRLPPDTLAALDQQAADEHRSRAGQVAWLVDQEQRRRNLLVARES